MRIIKSLILALLLLAQPAQAAHFTVTLFSDLTGQTATVQDTGYVTFDKKWYVYDGTNWIDCPGGACVLATKPFCHPDYTTTTDFAVSGATLATEIVAETTGQKIHICSIDWGAAGTTTFQLVGGTTTTTACDTATDNLTGAYSEIAQTGRVLQKDGNLKTLVGHKLCVIRSAAVAVDGSVQWRKAS